ncbi:hypothetical protein RFI_08385 [Reticulomyxa filosa]|uniref:Uncharacterized protein n=1 Tax=Reticulomyxa filosa TaxID=46433 RepID=X6NSK9_RETFI|nr:hypothetical protein RFI_08385 [Reticulomyxa filosa]|eukprot:ETO28744.1 hypothetical protein RFI_08385 [Reticulomyxa filosa]
MSRAKGSNQKLSRIIQNVEKSFEKKDYYGGEQMLKTVYTRLLNQENYEDASYLLQQGALKSFSHQQVNGGIYISKAYLKGVDLLDVWKKSGKILDDDKCKFLLECYSLIPPDELLLQERFVKNVVEWANLLINSTHNKASTGAKKGTETAFQLPELSPEQCLLVQKNVRQLYKKYGLSLYFNNKHYFNASQMLIKAGEVTPLIDLYADWTQNAPPKERPFFLTRMILQFLCLCDVSNARQLIDAITPNCLSFSFYSPFLLLKNKHFFFFLLLGECVLFRDAHQKNWKDDSRHPLENMCDLLVESFERKSVSLYQIVLNTYRPLLMKDEQLLHFVNKAAHLCLGVPAEGGGGFFQNLLSMLS